MLKKKPNLVAPGVYGVVAMQRLMLHAGLIEEITAKLDNKTVNSLKFHENFLVADFDDETPLATKYDHVFAKRVEDTCVEDKLLSYTDMSRAADALGLSDEQAQAFFTQLINWDVYTCAEAYEFFTSDFDLAYFIEKFSAEASEVTLVRMKKVFCEILGNDWYASEIYKRNAACFGFHEIYSEEAKTVGIFSIPLRNWAAFGFESVHEMKYQLFGGEGCCVDLLVSVVKKHPTIIDDIKNYRLTEAEEALRAVLMGKPLPQ